MRLNIHIVDLRKVKDESQQFALFERLRSDKVDVALVKAHTFLGEFASNNPEDI